MRVWYTEKALDLIRKSGLAVVLVSNLIILGKFVKFPGAQFYL